ncbi:hypothetical protein [Afifella pfennigii]|uniref:hypothetical protein n=1 Tax=Afifella pfennigii TaxID=209897 RepID=UPI0004788F3D|nr:hypothetical protein [Afifella pfennigii]
MDGAKSEKKAAREARLAEALRANLKRRKQKAKAASPAKRETSGLKAATLEPASPAIAEEE